MVHQLNTLKTTVCGAPVEDASQADADGNSGLALARYTVVVD